MLPTTRAEAKALGEPRYYTGIPCKAGHTAERQTSNHLCVECVAQHNVKAARDPKDRANRKRLAKAYLPKVRAAYSTVGSPRWVARGRAAARTRAARAGVPYDREAVDEILLAAKDVEVCPVLGIPLSVGGSLETSPSLDRIIPARGYTRGNMAIISGRANRLKSDGTLDELKRLTRWLERHHKENP